MTSEAWAAIAVGGVGVICSVVPQLLIHGYYRGKQQGVITSLTDTVGELKLGHDDHDRRLHLQDIRLTKVETVCRVRHGDAGYEEHANV